MTEVSIHKTIIIKKIIVIHCLVMLIYDCLNLGKFDKTSGLNPSLTHEEIIKHEMLTDPPRCGR